MYVGNWRGGRLWVMAVDAYPAGVLVFKSHPPHQNKHYSDLFSKNKYKISLFRIVGMLLQTKVYLFWQKNANE